MIRRNLWIALLLIPGLLSALYLLALRYTTEMHNRSVELAVDYSEIEDLSASTGMPIPNILARFKDAGITGVAVSEQLLSDLCATGEVFCTCRYQNGTIKTWVSVREPDLQRRVANALKARLTHVASRVKVFPQERSQSKLGGFPGVVVLEVEGVSPSTLSEFGVGLSPDVVRDIRGAGLDVVARLWNYQAISKQAIQRCLQDLRLQSITRLICAGDEILGFKGLLAYTGKQIEKNGLTYGSVEFAKQKGDTALTRELAGDFVRVHSIPYAEMSTMDPRSAVERFTRAVKERSIRLCYVRLIESTGEDSLATNARFVYAIRSSIERHGYHVGTARPFEDVKQPKVLLLVIALSIAAAGVLTIESLITISTKLKYTLVALGFIVFAGLILAGETGRQLVALSAALIFPVLGVVGVIGRYFACERHEEISFVRSTSIFLTASMVTASGGLIIGGMLGTRLYMVKAEQFVGIKIAHLFPILVILLVIAAGLPMFDLPLQEVRRSVWRNLRAVMAHPLFVWHALIILIGLAVLVIALMRTGNDAGIGVSEFELKFRSLLDRLLLVRPRTKEFLIGHPALLIGIMTLLAGKRSWALPLIALGMIGQVSMLNTFCHIHTPLTVTVIRTVNGLIVGIIFSFVIWLLIRRYIVQGFDNERQVNK